MSKVEYIPKLSVIAYCIRFAILERRKYESQDKK